MSFGGVVAERRGCTATSALRPRGGGACGSDRAGPIPIDHRVREVGQIRVGAPPVTRSEGAGDGYGASLFALGPQLAAAGVPAVIAFQGKVQMATVDRLIPVLLHELVAGTGIIDQCLAAARGALSGDEWWQAVLWLGTRDGRLWRPEGGF